MILSSNTQKLVHFMFIQYILKYDYSEIKLIKNLISFLKNDKIFLP